MNDHDAKPKADGAESLSTAGLGIKRDTYDAYEDEERYLKEMLVKIQAEYNKVAAPYIKRLVLIYSLRQAPPVIVTVTPEQAEALRLLMPNEPSSPAGAASCASPRGATCYAFDNERNEQWNTRKSLGSGRSTNSTRRRSRGR